MDYRLGKRDGQYKLLDFNPRIGTLFRLFQDDADIDVARALYLDVTGQSIPDGQPIEDRTFVVGLKDMFARWGYLERGQRSVGRWLTPATGGAERAWFATDDPSPFWLMCLWLCYRAISRPVNFTRRKRSDRGRPRFRSRRAYRRVWPPARRPKSRQHSVI